MGKNKDWNTPLTPEELKEIQKRLKGKGGSPGDVWKKIQASNRQPLMIADHGKYYNEYGQPIENPAYGLGRDNKRIYLKHMEQTPEEKKRNQKEHERKYHSNKKLGSNWSKRLLKAQGGRGHTTVGDKLYFDPVKKKLIPLPIDLESDKDRQIRHNKRYGFG